MTIKWAHALQTVFLAKQEQALSTEPEDSFLARHLEAAFSDTVMQ